MIGNKLPPKLEVPPTEFSLTAAKKAEQITGVQVESQAQQFMIGDAIGNGHFLAGSGITFEPMTLATESWGSKRSSYLSQLVPPKADVVVGGYRLLKGGEDPAGYQDRVGSAVSGALASKNLAPLQTVATNLRIDAGGSLMLFAYQTVAADAERHLRSLPARERTGVPQPTPPVEVDPAIQSAIHTLPGAVEQILFRNKAELDKLSETPGPRYAMFSNASARIEQVRSDLATSKQRLNADPKDRGAREAYLKQLYEAASLGEHYVNFFVQRQEIMSQNQRSLDGSANNFLKGPIGLPGWEPDQIFKDLIRSAKS